VRVVVKIGSSSVSTPEGTVDNRAISKLCGEVADQVASGSQIVVVTSGAIAAGLGPLGLGDDRPCDIATLQAVAAVGQPELMRAYSLALSPYSLTAGQVLLAPHDFADRSQYLHARRTIERLLELGVVPVVNENDVTADDEIRFGDNDRLSALVAHMVGADLLVLLTDIAGLHTSDPRLDREASLIEEVAEVDHHLESIAGGPGSQVGSGGMASKLAAAKIASWSGIRTVIADAKRAGVVAEAVNGVRGVGTVVRPRARRLPARKLWLAFAAPPKGRIVVDDGARQAVEERGSSLLAAGVTAWEGDFESGDVVEVAGPSGEVFAKGMVSLPSATLTSVSGRRSTELPDRLAVEVVHRDDLVVLSAK
jgi:glutamate 5-kinase